MQQVIVFHSLVRIYMIQNKENFSHIYCIYFNTNMQKNKKQEMMKFLSLQTEALIKTDFKYTLLKLNCCRLVLDVSNKPAPSDRSIKLPNTKL